MPCAAPHCSQIIELPTVLILRLADLQPHDKQAVNCLFVSLKASLAWLRRSWEGFGSPWGMDVLLPSVVSEWEVLLSHLLPS